MTDKQTVLESLQRLQKQKQSKKWYAERLGVSEQEVSELLAELKSSEGGGKTLFNESFTTVKVNNEKGTLESEVETTYEPKDDIELAKLHKIDLTKYKISTYWSKLKSNGKFTSSVLASLKKPTDITVEDMERVLQNYKPLGSFAPYVPSDKEVIDIEVSVADFHLAKKTLEGDTLYDKAEHYQRVVIDLVERVSAMYSIRTIVFPISNDFFHTDNYQNQTTNGTPQDVLTGYDEEYELGFTLLGNTIEYLQSKASEVKVILVQGNHDRTKSFYLAHGLAVLFRDNHRVSFDRGHTNIKGVTLGTTFIGYHHGNCKIDDLPLLFATSTFSLDFGLSTYREIHTGDKHHYMAKEIKGVRIQQMPSLSGTDRWHADNNYVNNIRAAIATMYHPLHGKIGELESRI